MKSKLPSNTKKETAVFAAGCFWGVQYYFDQVPGVMQTEAGYTGGEIDNPTYEDVCYRETGHAEAVKIVFDPRVISYATLLGHFFRMHDPGQLNQQGPDIGDQYRSAIFYLNNGQKTIAQTLITELKKEQNVVTKLESAGTFWRAESYHQKFAEKTGRGICHIPYKPL